MGPPFLPLYRFDPCPFSTFRHFCHDPGRIFLKPFCGAGLVGALVGVHREKNALLVLRALSMLPCVPRVGSYAGHRAFRLLPSQTGARCHE